ncbi:MAG: DUF5077 domain-containing protein [Verrucomicrobiaceae bacterium]|nr:MAG: DUF5077 domain-containing protein [Verrucomicrobiaceae bacterium]
MRPARGFTPRTKAKPTTSGTIANEVVRPARASRRRSWSRFMRGAADDNLVADGSPYYGAFKCWSSTDRYSDHVLALAFALQSPIVLPIKVAYTEPLPVGSVRDQSEKRRDIVWYGEARTDGRLALSIRSKAGDGHRPTIQVGKMKRRAVIVNGVASFGSFDVKKGPVRVAVSADQVPGPTVEALEATGDVRWNTSERLNAASVHFRWPTEKGADIRWFYNEAIMLTDPYWSYTAACGFGRGYLGFQVNDPGRRCVIFSVWDAGNEVVDRMDAFAFSGRLISVNDVLSWLGSGMSVAGIMADFPELTASHIEAAHAYVADHKTYYAELFGREADFRVTYRLFTAEEGGRKTPAYQGIRWDICYAEDTSAKTRMVYPEFIDPDGFPVPNGPFAPIGRADMFVLSPDMLSFHRQLIHSGTRGYFMEGSTRVGVWEVAQVLGLRQEPQ